MEVGDTRREVANLFHDRITLALRIHLRTSWSQFWALCAASEVSSTAAANTRSALSIAIEMTPPLHLDLTVDGHAEAPQLHAAIKAALRRLLPAFAPLNDDAIEVTTVSGGISNALYKAAPSAAAAAAGGGSAAPPAVAFRIYGDSTEEFIDRSRELGVMRLAHEHGFGPQVGAGACNTSCAAWPLSDLREDQPSASLTPCRSCWPPSPTGGWRPSSPCAPWRCAVTCRPVAALLLLKQLLLFLPLLPRCCSCCS